MPRLAKDRLEILWAGRFEPQKDAPLALRTIAALNQSSRARLTMLGEGYLRPKMERLAQSMGLGDKVRFMGHVPAIDPFLHDADAFFVSSSFEGGPAVAVEALAHGVPVVSTDCSFFLRDIMTIPEAGLIVPSRRPDELAQALLAVAEAPRPAPWFCARLSRIWRPMLAPTPIWHGLTPAWPSAALKAHSRQSRLYFTHRWGHRRGHDHSAGPYPATYPPLGVSWRAG
jgi:glycosyltransferase involved in cell wall biosynthesis